MEPSLGRSGAFASRLADEPPVVCALLTGSRTDSQICRSAIDLSGCERDIALIVVRGVVHASAVAAAGVDARTLRHTIDMEARARARALCTAHGFAGRPTFAVLDRLTPSACVRAAQDLHCNVLVVPDRWRTRLRRRGFARAGRRGRIEVLMLP